MKKTLIYKSFNKLNQQNKIVCRRKKEWKFVMLQVIKMQNFMIQKD